MSVEEKRSTIDNLKDREKVKRVKGRQRTAMLGKYVLDLNKDIDKAMAGTDPDLWERVLRDMGSSESKASASELQQECEMYERGIKKKRKVTKSEENPNGMLITPEMGGKIVLSVLQKGKGHMNQLRAEIEERGIEPPESIDGMKWKEVIDLLRIDEYKRLVELELAQDIERWTNVKDITPQSDKMMGLFNYQEEYFLAKQARQTKL